MQEALQRISGRNAGMVQGVRQVIPDCPVTLDDLILWNGYEELTGSGSPTQRQNSMIAWTYSMVSGMQAEEP